MTKTIIIPDIHNRYAIAEAIIDLENPDLVVFLGDYFDYWGDDTKVEVVANTARWLNESVDKANRIHLFGNHDLWYSCGDDRVRCAGNTEFKRHIIKQYFNKWDRLRFHYWANDWLCTHAGLSAKLPIPHDVTQELLDAVERERENHWLLRLVGEYRGGIEGEVGGILWCHHPEEFEDIPNIKQVFGHTCRDRVSWNLDYEKKAEHIRLDTASRDYLVLINGTPMVKSTHLYEEKIKDIVSTYD